MRRILPLILVALGAIPVLLFFFLFVGKAPAAESITWGVNFSQKHAANFGLDWKKAYLAILEDLGAKELKIATYWDFLEPQNNQFSFEDMDWQINEAASHGAKVLLVVGMKTPRWPECHIPAWALGFSKKEQQEAILEMLRAVAERYKNSPSLSAWQVENEPFFPFGECPWQDAAFLQKEIGLVQSIDSEHPVFTSESGELSLWIRASLSGDKVAVTMYRKAWFEQFRSYVDYPFPPVFYWRKAWLIDRLFSQEVIVGELQAEPWGPKLLYDVSLEEQRKTMNPEQFRSNIVFARATGLNTFYLWGAEWWYWMKEVHGQEEIWQEAKSLFSTNQ